MALTHEHELEFELEQELESESEHEYESEFGEFESEFEYEGEAEYEGEEFLGKALKKFGKVAKGLAKKAAPMLGKIAKVAVPLVAKAVGGPFGGMISQAAGALLKEDEYELEGEFESEFGEYESEFESEFEVSGEEEFGEFEVGSHEALAELMAEMAAYSANEHEAEAAAGAAAMTSISPRDRSELRQVLPHLVKGVAVLTRVLRSRSTTKPFVRTVPAVFRSTVKTLRKQAAAGRPVTRKAAARVMAGQTRKMLTSPRRCAHALTRSMAASRVAKKPKAAPVRG